MDLVLYALLVAKIKFGIYLMIHSKLVNNKKNLQF